MYWALVVHRGGRIRFMFAFPLNSARNERGTRPTTCQCTTVLYDGIKQGQCVVSGLHSQPLSAAMSSILKTRFNSIFYCSKMIVLEQAFRLFVNFSSSTKYVSYFVMNAGAVLCLAPTELAGVKSCPNSVIPDQLSRNLYPRASPLSLSLSLSLFRSPPDWPPVVFLPEVMGRRLTTLCVADLSSYLVQ